MKFVIRRRLNEASVWLYWNAAKQRGESPMVQSKQKNA